MENIIDVVVMIAVIIIINKYDELCVGRINCDVFL